MSVRRMLVAPPCHAHFPMDEYEHLELFDAEGVMAHAAVGEHADCLELHLDVVRWGPQSMRAMKHDLNWLRGEAKRRGKTRIIGIRQEKSGEPDPKWVKFTKLYGFTGQAVVQTAYLEV